MLLLVMLVGMATALLVYGMVDTNTLALRRDKDVAAVLAQAKQAVIGRAVSDANRPGSLPCPDTDNDGSAEIFVGPSLDTCPSYIGRLPWKTLGLPDLRDSDGERLWYALSSNFRDHANAEPINSDKKGLFTITGTSPATEIIAVVFAPGRNVGAQDRSAANENTVAHYLEGGNETGIAASTFVTGATTTTFNDRLLALTGADIMTPVEQRVAREMLAVLNLYRNSGANTCGCYTWGDNDFNNEGDNDVYRGWLPLWQGDPHDWLADLGIPVPAWLIQNEWWKVVYYAVAPDESQNKSGGTLTVDGASGTRVVLITPGPAAPGVPRPVNAPGSPAYWAEYLKDAANSDHADNTYVRPSSTAYARNRLYTIP
jgi:hypothetical protein